MRLSLAIIGLNEIDYLPQCLDSLTAFADEIVFVDGGSQDGTLELVKSWHGEHPGIAVKLGVSPWANDFSAQRQVSFDACSGDWIMRVDCDETTSSAVRLSVKRVLASLPQQCLAVRVRQLNFYPDEEHYAADCGGWETWPRIWRRIPGLTWVGAVHEHVMVRGKDGELREIPEARIWDWNAVVFHRGWLDRKRRQDREDLYRQIPGSGFTKEGDLVDRRYVIKRVPEIL